MAKKKGDPNLNKNSLGKAYGGPDGVSGTPDDARRKESKYYLIRDRKFNGRKKKYETGDQIYEVALEYFQAADDNPMKETKVFGSGHQVDLDLQIPYTLTGFYLFAGIDAHIFKRYKELVDREDCTDDERSLSEACHQIDAIIYTQKIEGASTGKFNHQIIALQLGLAAKVKNENVTYDAAKMTADEIKKMNQELEDKY